MLNKISKGVLSPCPVCGSNDYIDWSGYRYISLVCNNCGFEMYPEKDESSEKEYFQEWNNLKNIDALIENQDKLIAYLNELVERANKAIKECEEKKAHLIWTKQRINEAKKNLPIAL
jgi:predicted nucleic-acid-binding Zn-ribbon protein